MKKLRVFALAALCAALICGCAARKEAAPAEQTVYASFYPVYALAAQVLADVPAMRLYCLIQPQDGCPRSYSLSDWDAALLSGADALILGGRGLESFESALDGGPIALVSAMGGLTLIERAESAEEDSHFRGASPWAFLSAEGAKAMCGAIAAAMAALDPDYAHLYQKNLTDAVARLDSMKADMLAETEGLDLPGAVLLHEGLEYFAREMGVEECVSVEREPGTDYVENDLQELLARVKAAGYRLVLIERQAPQSLVGALEAEGCAVCLVDTLCTRSAVDGGEGYFAAMRENAAALRQAVGAAAGE